MRLKTIRDLCDINYNTDTCIIMGNGTSVLEYKHNPNVFTIGVNDIPKLLDPDMLFIVDKREKFDKERILYIEKCKSKYIAIYDSCWNFDNDKKYMISFGGFRKLNGLDNKESINTGFDSPYMAIQLAYKMGFKKIGIIGVDYTDDHFYKKDGKHILVLGKKINQINELYKNLYKTLAKKNVRLFNLSKHSKIETIPYLQIEKIDI